MSEPEPIAATRRWLQRAVIGLNLCPFAKAVQVKDQIRYVLSEADTPDALLADLADELLWLHEADPEVVDTTLLIHPRVLTDFDDYNEFLDQVDAAIDALGLEGEIQAASFHPDYRFAGSDLDDVANCTNRSPYPMLHLLREESIDRAVEAFPDPEEIVERNIARLEQLGLEGYRRLLDE
ncbi:DUF1415 domain-containing protein [Novilysobacter antarcticus]|uniref:DUF1415 domain-containing protein n=1 Tax=Novilysobacter antarcticus TaxID=2862543 RepID=UPI001C9955B5|nr:DUF1415 domain-containing protein [Lysobacter antarcticus]